MLQGATPAQAGIDAVAIKPAEVEVERAADLDVDQTGDSTFVVDAPAGSVVGLTISE